MALHRYIILFYFMIFGFSNPSFAFDCDLSQKNTCDECRKCGGIWCNDPDESRRCVPSSGGGDEWCPELLEPIPNVDLKSRDGEVFRPQFEDVLAEINSGKVTTLPHHWRFCYKEHQTRKYHCLCSNWGVRKVVKSAAELGKRSYYKILNTTRSSDISKVHVQITKHHSQVQVTTTISAGFCSAASQKFEYAYVEVGMSGVAEKAVLKYVMPCGCDCSEDVVPVDRRCHGRGDLVCGNCQCKGGWHGKFCECGPVSSSCVGSSITATCSGNGECDKCNQCKCFNDKQGSQYFDQEDNCKDLSATVSEFLNCQKIEQPCDKCGRDVFFHKWDGSLLNQMYDSSRKLWVGLGPSLPGYWGSMVNSTVHIMRKPLC